jgi:ubiquinone/menaquinone biosynthesis C-methylase UbiE
MKKNSSKYNTPKNKIAASFLPSNFGIDIPTQKKPVDLYNYLVELFSQEQMVNPNDEYLTYHASPSSILLKIYSFDWYLPFIPKDGELLDWGCNHAPDSCLIRASFGNVHNIRACDYREPGLFPHFSKAANIEYHKLTDHIKLPFDSNSFDAVIASGALEHAAIDYASLQELYRIIKPEGKLIITYLPNKYSYEEWIFEHVRHSNFHMRRYSLSSFKQLLKSNGFFPIAWGFQTAFWEWRLAKIGIRKHELLCKLLYALFPINAICGCFKVVAVKKQSM